MGGVLMGLVMGLLDEGMKETGIPTGAFDEDGMASSRSLKSWEESAGFLEPLVSCAHAMRMDTGSYRWV